MRSAHGNASGVEIFWKNPRSLVRRSLRPHVVISCPLPTSKRSGLMPQTPNAPPASTAEIFARLWEGTSGDMPPAVARHILSMRFSDEDVARMRDLSRRNREATLSATELDELDGFVFVADLLSILHSIARTAQKRATGVRKGHG